MKSYLRAVRAVIWKDFITEWRSRENLSAMLVFALLVILIFNFALELDVQARDSLSAGILWTTFIFSGTIGLNRSLAVEKDRGCLDGLLLAPVDRSVIFFGKTVANLTFMLMVEAVVLPIFSFLYGIQVFQPGFLGVVLLGSIGYASVGTLLATMVVQVRTRDILLPILLFPLTLPVIIAAVKASQGFIQLLPMTEISIWINILVAYDLIFIAAAFMVFDFVLEE
ncbi:MAG: heme exporter protein CcmB [Anaerolineales bacterium]|nr:heme exporter protein CcmB [Anaerolineales bacterium]